VDGAGEHPGVLEHHAEGTAHLVAGEVAVVDAVEQDAPGVDLVEAHEQVDDRGLARAGRSDDGDRLARRDVEREVLDERLVGLVGEEHVLERDAARSVRRRGRLERRGKIGRLLVGVEELEDALGRGEARLEHVHLAGDLGDRHRELARVLDERRHGPSDSSPEATRYPPSTAMVT
jgi:hypothetical protein